MPPENLSQNDPTSFEAKKPIFGSTTRIHHEGCIIVCGKTGKHVENAILKREIEEKMIEEKKAQEIVFFLRDKCMDSHAYNPSGQELRTALVALGNMWFFLPDIKKYPEERNRDYFFRVLREVGAFRRVNMFHRE